MSLTNFPNGISSFGVPVYGSLPPIRGQWFFVDVARGAEGNSGKQQNKSFDTFLTAYTACTSSAGDGICILSSSTAADSNSSIILASLDWTKHGITVVGVAAPTGYFHRSRITATTADLAYLWDISGSNNSFYNLFVLNEGTANTCLGNVIVSGNRNYFNNCHLLGGASDVPGAVALCNSLSLKASECTFDDCTFGTNSTVHAQANAPIQFTTTQQGQNLFRRCRVISKSSTAGHGGVNLVGTTVMNGWTEFHDCTFTNFSATGGAKTALTKVVIGDAQTDCGLLFHNCSEVGWAAWSVLASKAYVGCSGETAAGAGGIATAPAA